MKDFLFFTKGERNGLCLLLALVGISIAFSCQISHLTPPPEEDTTQLELALAQFKANLQEEEQRKYHPKYKEAVHSTEKETTKKSYVRTEKNEKRPTLSPIEINTADTTEFKKLKGIGSTYAARIVKFREKLGGFHSVDQIKEVYGIKEDLYESIRPHLKVDTNKLRRIDLNDESFTWGFYHPYFPKKGVSTLLKTRKERGRIEKNEVKELLQMEDKEWNRLAPYLKD
ncbi:MAG: helix-hairpin-helix domain-containing protein [Paludibacteraceae bacterium]|nr:helix-hairpin-helix domain-containing protein [Paludibacteraceae bacterium]